MEPTLLQETSRGHSAARAQKVKKLMAVDAATTVVDLRTPPGNRLEKLRGERAEQWSVRINRQWRVCFRWHEGDAYDVEIADYH